MEIIPETTPKTTNIFSIISYPETLEVAGHTRIAAASSGLHFRRGRRAARSQQPVQIVPVRAFIFRSHAIC
jgi:hypothetical protein